MFLQDCDDVQADLSIRLTDIPEETFSHSTADTFDLLLRFICLPSRG